MHSCKPVDLQSVQDRYKNGDRVAGYILGRHYQRGEYVERDEKKASSIFVDLAEQGHWGSKGRCHEYGYQPYLKSIDKAVECYRKGVEEGDEVSLTGLGVCYANGTGVKRDRKKAVALYSQAADKGYAVAVSNLGYCYQNGKGVKVDEKKAAALYGEAAERGYAVAISNLGYCYQNGKGVDKDREKAIECYKKSADLGEVRFAMTNLKRMGIGYTPSLAKQEKEVPAREGEKEREKSQNEGGTRVPVSSNMEDWTVEEVAAFVFNMGLGPKSSEIAAKFGEAIVNGKELVSYSNTDDVLEEVDIPKKAARIILEQRDAYLARIQGDGDPGSPMHGTSTLSTPSSSRHSTPSCPKMTEESVFISLRFGEAMEEAIQLKAALQKEGHDAYLCEVAPGANIKEVVVQRLAAAKLVVIMGTKTYGAPGTVNFSTKQELEYILDQEKPFFLIKMCDNFEDEMTKFNLPKSTSYVPWEKGTPLPAGVVKSLIEKYKSLF